MRRLARLAFIGNSLPRRCGIATFTSDLQQAVAGSYGEIETGIVAMTDHGHAYDYPPIVSLEVDDQRLDEYVRAADYLNARGTDVVSLQHEFGIFGGEGGDHILALLSRLTMPVVTTLHTVLAEPTAAQRRVMEAVVAHSATLVVMAEKGRDLLQSIYGVPAGKIVVVPHGIPDVAFGEPDAAKAELGFSNRSVILTFGLLSPNKGIEVMIDAMPGILARRPDAVYVVLGATHPNLVREQGEAYRDSLVRRVRELGIEDSVVFLDQFVDQQTLLRFIAMCDVYVTPYLHEAQMTSGTLSYSFGLGKAVVSTPYWHAQELLADGRGVLVPFSDPRAIGDAISALLTDPALRQAMRHRAYASSRSMTWRRTAERYAEIFERACNIVRLKPLPREGAAAKAAAVTLPDMRLDHLLAMSDDTGLFQHADRSVPDRAHGYCVDDNARALLVACALNEPGEIRLPELLTVRYAAFLQHAWNPGSGRFRNFMGYDRRWLEDQGSEDSHGRTLWALGECARSDANASRRDWSASLFAQALGVVETFGSPRAWAFTLLGLDAYLATEPENASAKRLRRVLADRLMASLAAAEQPNWTWFEAGLSYDNARIPQALIVTGSGCGDPSYVADGLRSLRWLMTKQMAPHGWFRPVGSESFGETRRQPRPFDQQPLEATATIAACFAALRADGDKTWERLAEHAFAWFFGRNDLGLPLVDVGVGSCLDGLHPDRANENRGGESVVSYLLGLAEIRQRARFTRQPPRLSIAASPLA